MIATGIGRKVFTLETNLGSRKNVRHAVIDEKDLVAGERERGQDASKIFRIRLGRPDYVRVELAVKILCISQDR